MSRAMTMQELGELLNHIKAEHSFCQNHVGRHVKYVDPKIDTRDLMCFAITFRLFGEGVTFHTQNKCRDLPETLYERCMKWLDEPVSSKIDITGAACGVRVDGWVMPTVETENGNDGLQEHV